MKKLIMAFILTSSSLLAQKAEKIYSITVQPRDDKFYTEQASLWKAEVAKKPKDAEAWENYYLATRYASHAYEANSDKQKTMEEIVKGMEKNVPNTLPYYHCKLSVNGWPNKDTASSSIIAKALAIDPNDRVILTDYVVYCELTGKTAKLNEVARKLYNTNTYAQGVLEMGYNILMSADKNAIVFTWGDNDTFPEWMLQEAKGMRTDVSVINIPLCFNHPYYLKRMLLQKNITLSDDFWNREQSAKTTTDLIKMLVLEINKTNPSVPIFMATTQSLENVFPDSLYCTGLTYFYSTKRIDNMARLRNNVENHFHLDYLNGTYNDNSVSADLIDQCNELYVTPFALLYKHYRSMNESNDRTEFYKSFVMKYAARIGKEQEMKEYLESK
ncbi:MAG TPA: hypothetical protein VK783_03735 [Bacteroidia bacterium]|jgi:hypothetical protein|nr:hypothetical protein [Bacteroidia bacterium]